MKNPLIIEGYDVTWLQFVCYQMPWVVHCFDQFVIRCVGSFYGLCRCVDEGASHMIVMGNTLNSAKVIQPGTKESCVIMGSMKP